MHDDTPSFSSIKRNVAPATKLIATTISHGAGPRVRRRPPAVRLQVFRLCLLTSLARIIWESPMPFTFRRLLLAAACLATFAYVQAQTIQAPDITKHPTLYVVPYAHLDTQWRWEFPQTISEYLLKTMRVNFDLIEKYPHYVFNWTGSNRYRLMKEYFPPDYEKVRQYVAAGRWYPAGSSVEEGDVNMLSAEAR